MIRVFWVGLCVTLLALMFVTTSIFGEREPINFTTGVAGGGDSVKFDNAGGGKTVISTFVDTNDAINIDSFYCFINTDGVDENGLVMWLAWDSINGDTSLPTDTLVVSLKTAYGGAYWRNPEDSLLKTLRCDTLGRYGYLTYKYLSDSIKDTLFYFDTWFELIYWDSTSDTANVNTEHKLKLRGGYKY